MNNYRHPSPRCPQLLMFCYISFTLMCVCSPPRELPHRKNQESANLSCHRPDSKYFQLWGLWSLHQLLLFASSCELAAGRCRPSQPVSTPGGGAWPHCLEQVSGLGRGQVAEPGMDQKTPHAAPCPHGTHGEERALGASGPRTGARGKSLKLLKLSLPA